MSTTPSEPTCYLDHAAATPLLPEAAEALQATTGLFGNPSSPHAAGRAARQMLEEARERIITALGGQLSGAQRSQLVFTSGATEANQAAITGLQAPGTPSAALLYSARDHAGTVAAARQLNTGERSVTQLPLDASGRLDRAALNDALQQTPAAVLSTTVACSQSGTLEHLADIVAAHPSVILHVDAVQAVGRLSPNLYQQGVSSIALASHKLGGPRGIGGLFLTHGVALHPLLPGSQERGLRGGTESVALAVAFAVALEIAIERQAEEAQRLAALRDRCERGIVRAAKAAGIDAIIIGETVPRAPHISVIALPGRNRQATVMAADLAGICLASGTACSSGSSEPSPALVSAGLSPGVVESAIRVSLGWSTAEADIEQAVRRLRTQVFRLPA